MKITLWRREDENTTPRGFGYLPTYSVDKPATSDLVWAEEVDCWLPDGWQVGVTAFDTHEIYDDKGERVDITDDNGHPAYMTGVYFDGKTSRAALKRLDHDQY